MKMNIDILVKNLKRTIAGKERYRDSLDTSVVGHAAVAQFLDTNLTELKAILADVNTIKNSMEESNVKEEV